MKAHDEVSIEKFIKAALAGIKNGSLTIVMQDCHAIQLNTYERYIFKTESIEEAIGV